MFRASGMMGTCERCDATRAECDALHTRVVELEGELSRLRNALRELDKVCALQQGDIARMAAVIDTHKARETPAPPSINCPERVPQEQLQLAFAEVLAALSATGTDNDNDKPVAPAPPARGGDASGKPKPKRRRGRRNLDLSRLPVMDVQLDPDEVIAAGGVGFVRIGQEVSDRIAYRPGSFLRIRITRTKWVSVTADAEGALAVLDDDATPPPNVEVRIAPTLDCLWPRMMADTSAVAQCIVAKYDDCLPLYRQQQITTRHGFPIPRSTMFSWTAQVEPDCARVVAAMWDDMVTHAFCIATDATGVPVRAPGKSVKHHMFVFIGDIKHVVFRHSDAHKGDVVHGWLKGFEGYLQGDAASIYDVLFRVDGMIEVGCWAHVRRYFWKALDTEPSLARQGIALIAELFRAYASCEEVEPPDRTPARVDACLPVLTMIDQWVARVRGECDPAGRVASALTYYENQREALRRFLEDARLRLDNNPCEGGLRRVVLGTDNWKAFANERGLELYATYRSLIASCHLHGLNPQTYLEQMLRLVRVWPRRRMLELSPAYWNQTVASLDARYRAVLTPPWEHERRVPMVDDAPRAAVGA